MTSFRGFPACTCLAEWLPVFEQELLRRGVIKSNIDIYQLIGGAVASGGTHAAGGAFDVAQGDATTIKVARQMGADATWRRKYNWDGRGGMAHTHGVLRGCPHNGPARYQITSTNYGVDHGHNGLANGAKDDGPRPLSGRTWQEGIKWAKAQQPKPFAVRVGTFNLPGDDKLPNAAGRVEAAAKMIAGQHLDIIGLNELIGRRGEGEASTFALSVHAAVEKATGLSWTLMVPTTDLNENYALINDATLEVRSQWGDYIIRTAGLSGRHVTRALVRHKQTGRKFAFGVTHLINDNRPGAQKQSVSAGKAVQDIGDKHNVPVIIVGDQNTSDDLTGYAALGLVNTRKKAKATTNTNYATFAKYDATGPSKNTAWRIDQIWATRNGLAVTGQTLVLGAPGGTFTKPRPSDHGLLVTALTYV